MLMGKFSLCMCSSMKKDSSLDDSDMRGGSRWRSDESSEDEAQHVVDRHTGGTTQFAARRRARFLRR